MSGRPLRHALVAGGSIAGLLAARVLADFFERVTLAERDTVASGADARRGVPQGRHIHALLARGREVFETLFPGIGEELRADGAVLLNGARDVAWHYAGDWRVRYDGHLPILCMSRPLLEAAVARRLRAVSNVALLDGTGIDDLTDDGNGSVTGARIAGAAGEWRDIAADLVVDATGRGSALPRWLAGMGYEAPREELLEARVAYASCVFRQPERRPDWRAMLVTGPCARRSGMIFPIEGGRWIATLNSRFGEPSPRDHASFLAFARSLPVPDLHEALRAAEPVSAVACYRFVGSLRRRYGRLARLPEGVIAIGDAVCSFNPMYGQGMTVAAVEAERLAAMLAEARRDGGLASDFGPHWFRAVEPAVDGAWNGVAIEDLRFPELADRRPARVRPLQWYMAQVHSATHRSAAVTDQFYRVMNFLDRPATLFRPRILADVLLGGLDGSRKRARRAPGSSALAHASGQPR
jgi:2-polyprenyl-6-methoxyphenol hydroxylase-like FAD-dependent oxidoreductase